MEDNWKTKATELVKNIHWINPDGTFINEEQIFIDNLLKFGNLVFEATKKECAKKAEAKYNHTTIATGKDYWIVNEESILNINKPNL